MMQREAACDAGYRGIAIVSDEVVRDVHEDP
jgi:hypothetical protein